MKFRSTRTVIVLCIVSSCAVFFLFNTDSSKPQIPKNLAAHQVDVKRNKFDNFNNETGADQFVVPNIVHYVRFDKKSFTFSEYICLLTVFVHQKPEKIYFHTNLDKFEGTYWNKITGIQELHVRIQLKKTELPHEIYNQKLSSDFKLWHASDITRIRTMMRYGGIYLDDDMYVVRNLDKFRKFELVMGWDQDQFLGSQVIIANKDARFLPMWLETYREYRPDLWYYNAGEKPTKEILLKRPELLHRVKLDFGVDMLAPELYEQQWNGWRHFYTIHLLTSHRDYLDPHFKEYPEFNETNIQTYNYTFGEMARDVLQYFDNPIYHQK